MNGHGGPGFGSAKLLELCADSYCAVCDNVEEVLYENDFQSESVACLLEALTVSEEHCKHWHDRVGSDLTMVDASTREAELHFFVSCGEVLATLRNAIERLANSAPAFSGAAFGELDKERRVLLNQVQDDLVVAVSELLRLSELVALDDLEGSVQNPGCGFLHALLPVLRSHVGKSSAPIGGRCTSESLE